RCSFGVSWSFSFSLVNRSNIDSISDGCAFLASGCTAFVVLIVAGVAGGGLTTTAARAGLTGAGFTSAAASGRRHLTKPAPLMNNPRIRRLRFTCFIRTILPEYYILHITFN